MDETHEAEEHNKYDNDSSQKGMVKTKTDSYSHEDKKAYAIFHMTPLWILAVLLLAVGSIVGYRIANQTGSSSAAVSFRGDYESGNLSQWGNCQFVGYNNPCSGAGNTHSVRAQTAVKRQGNYAARFELRDGDTAVGSNERTEVATSNIGGTEGREMWYAQSILFDSSFNNSSGWGAVSQFKGSGGTSPPMGIYVDHPGGQWGLTINNYSNSSSFTTNQVWSTATTKNTWHDIKLHVKWSANDSVGFVELWHNGVQQTFKGACAGKTRCVMSNMVPGGGSNYYKQGYYRCACVNGTGVVYHDGFTVATDPADLGVPTPTPSPSPTPTPSPSPTPTPSPTPSPGGSTEQVVPEVVVKGLDTPWSMDFASDGTLFFTERPGRLKMYKNNAVSTLLTISGTESLSAEEGLQGMALDPNFASNGYIYVYYTYNSGGLKNRLVRYTFNKTTSQVGSPLTLVDNIPGYQFHNGGRIKFGPDGKLYVATGEAVNNNSTGSSGAQNLGSLAGKILRINSDGTIPADNPFSNSRVWSYGHRNPQGLAWHPVTGQLWSTEHGPTGNPCCHDEINIIQKGSNYGWPKYYARLTHPLFTNLQVSNPVYPAWESGSSKWAPGGAIFYKGTKLSGPWKNSLIFGGLGIQGTDGGRALYRLKLGSDNRTPSQLETLYKNQYGRLREVAEAPDGSIYIATSNRDGRGSPIADDDRIIRLRPNITSTTPTPSPAPSPSPSPSPSPGSESGGVTVEAENATKCKVDILTSSSCSSKVVRDDITASNGKAVILRSGGSYILQNFTTGQEGTYKYGFVLRSQSYRGNAKMNVYVDNKLVKRSYTLASKYQFYFFNSKLGPGQHTVKVAFANDKCGNWFPRERCTFGFDRNILVDQFVLNTAAQ